MEEVVTSRFLPPLPSKSDDLEMKKKRNKKSRKKIKGLEDKDVSSRTENDVNIFSISNETEEMFSKVQTSIEDQPKKPKRSKKNRKLEYPTEQAPNEEDLNKSEDNLTDPSLPQTRIEKLSLRGRRDNQALQSHSTGKLFVEHQTRFISVNKIEEGKDITSIESYSAPSHLALDVAINAQRYFCIVGTFCSGLFAGIAMWQCIISYQLTSPKEDLYNYLMYYRTWVLPIQSLFFFLAVITTMFAFDKFDIHHLRWNVVKEILTCQSGFIIIIIYPITLILSLSIFHIDNKFLSYNLNSTSWNSTDYQEMVSDVIYWRNMNTARSVFAILGWLIVSMLPKTDYFEDFLKTIREDDDSIPDISKKYWDSI